MAYSCAIIAMATLTTCVISQEENKDFVGNIIAVKQLYLPVKSH